MLIKSNAPKPGKLTPLNKLPAIPPGAPAASCIDCAALATPSNLLARFSIGGIGIFFGPFPITH